MRDNAAESDVAADSRVALSPERRTRCCSNAVPVTATMPVSESGSIAADDVREAWWQPIATIINGATMPATMQTSIAYCVLTRMKSTADGTACPDEVAPIAADKFAATLNRRYAAPPPLSVTFTGAVSSGLVNKG